MSFLSNKKIEKKKKRFLQYYGAIFIPLNNCSVLFFTLNIWIPYSIGRDNVRRSHGDGVRVELTTPWAWYTNMNIYLPIFIHFYSELYM